MTASLRDFPVRVSPAFCAEARAIRPVTLADALTEYADDVHAMTDEGLAREIARVEALPGSHFRRLANDEADDRRNRAALLAAMAPPMSWGWTA